MQVRGSGCPSEALKGKLQMIAEAGSAARGSSLSQQRTNPVPNGSPARHTSRSAMASTTQCHQCGIVLNVPDQALGRRLKCPHCGARFGAVPGDPRSSQSSFLLQRPEVPDRPDSSVEALPTVSGEVRETYEPPLMKETSAPAKPSSRPVAKPTPAARPVADALGLFEDGPKKPRRVTQAEARSQARRCPTCGGVVPAGMSLCSRCGLDLETGARVDLEDDVAPPPEPRAPALPLPVLVVGGISLLASMVFMVLSFAFWLRGFDGYQYFVPICLFGIYASVQLLRQKSVRLLLIALSFGLAIDLVALIAMPIHRAHMAASTAVEQPNGAEGEEFVIPSVVDKLDTNSLSVGIGLILLYAGVAFYLLTPQVKRHFR
jgi:hypothetical protein